MLVTSSQSSTQRSLGLSVEELYGLDRQYRRIEQQQQHLAQLSSSNLNRLASRSLDLGLSSSSATLPILPSLEIQGHNYSNRAQPPPPPSSSSILNYPRSHSIDQYRYVPAPPPAPVLKYTYPQRTKTTDIGQQNYESKYRTPLQPSVIPSNNNFLYEQSDNRTANCKLRRQQPLKRESSRRIVVRPVVHRRREPSLSSSCESLDESRPIQSFIEPISFTPSTSLIEDVIENLSQETRNDSFSDDDDDDDINLYEMRVLIGKTYDTSDISVQLEGSKILIHCHTIEPTDKRGNYRKHEYKSELIVPNIVDNETIVAYLTENGELIVEGKYHLWAWKEMKRTKKSFEQNHHRFGKIMKKT